MISFHTHGMAAPNRRNAFDSPASRVGQSASSHQSVMHRPYFGTELEAPSVATASFAPSATRPHQASRSVRLLLPAETPLFFLHGTSNSGAHLNPLTHWLGREVSSEHPTYVGYLPEIQLATGIETVDNPQTTVPAYLLAFRELGAFRYQSIHQRLQTLANDLTKEPLARVFKLRDQDAAWLEPLIREHVLAPLAQVPAGWHAAYQRPLKELVAAGTVRIRAEVDKLYLRPDEQNRAIYDTEFLASRARYQGKTANFDMERLQDDEDVINIRPLHLKDAALLEGYLLSMQTTLANAIRGHQKAQLRASGQPSQPGTSADERRALQMAEKTAEKIMDVIAPRLAAIGHSQGGTVLRMAHMYHTQHRPSAEVDFSQTDPRDFVTLPGRVVGLEMPLSSPLGGGIPSIPAWGHKLLGPVNALEQKLPIIARYPGSLARWVEQSIWAHKTKNKPAISEMRQNSPVVQKIRERIAHVEDKGVTVLNVMAEDDAYVEPAASLLQDDAGRYPVNVFNLQVHTDQKIPPIFTHSDDLVGEVAGAIPVVGPLLARWMPQGWKDAAQRFYEEELIGMEQHRALVTFPDTISREVGQLLTMHPEHRDQALDPRQFEPFRYQALQVTAGRLRRQLQDKSPGEAVVLLEQFLAERPTLVEQLIGNAREDLPLKNTAASVARDVLQTILTVSRQGLQSLQSQEVAQREANQSNSETREMVLTGKDSSVMGAIADISQANFSNNSPENVSIQNQATALLKALAAS